jgi:WD40 repeat-containing protein SMU1
MSRITPSEPGRLLKLLSQALKLQRLRGELPHDGHHDLDLFHGAAVDSAAKRAKVAEIPPLRLATTVKMSKKDPFLSLIFSPDGRTVVTGASDGLVEVYDAHTGQRKPPPNGLPKDTSMLMGEGVLSLAVSLDGRLLATGSERGVVYVWVLETWNCLRKIAGAHSGPVTALCFGADGSTLLSGSNDNTAVLHGLKGGVKLKEFKGHTTWVTAATFSNSYGKVLTGAADGDVKLWDCRTAECLLTWASGYGKVHTLQPVDQAQSLFLIAGTVSSTSKGSCAYLVTETGKRIKEYRNPATHDFLSAAISGRGSLVVAASSSGELVYFSRESAAVVEVVKDEVTEGTTEVIYCPSENTVASLGKHLMIWRE